MTLTELHAANGLLIDANLLILLIVGNLNPAHIHTHKRTANKYSAEDYTLLISFVDQFKASAVVTTPNILTEVSNLLEGYSYKGQQALTILERFATGTKEISHESSSTMNLHPKSYLKFGLSDAVIHRIAEENYLVLTDDLNFCAYLQGQGLLAINFTNLRID